MKLKGLQFPVILFSFSFLFSCLWFYLNFLGCSIIFEFELFSGSSLRFSIALIIDKISLSFGVVVILISGSVFTFTHKYMEEDPFRDRFLWILILFVLSINILTWSGSLFFLLLGWDGLGITSFALIIYYQRRESLLAGFQTLIANRVGDSLIVLSTFLFVLNHHFSFFSINDFIFFRGLVLLLVFAALTKRAQFPFSFWLPAAIAAPTPVRALVHSSTLVTAGIFLVIRVRCFLPLDELSKQLLTFLGAITCLLGRWSATLENDLKKIIALSTLSQLGVIVFRLGLGYSNIALFHLYTHALFKALLFLTAGHILMATFGVQDIRLLGSVGLCMPFTTLLFNIRNLCLIGTPFLRSFFSKHLILELSSLSILNLRSFFIILFATMFTAKYVVRRLKRISWNKPVRRILSNQSSLYTVGPIFILGLGAIARGKFFSLIDITNLETISMSSLWGFIINIVTIRGLIWGLSSGSSKKFFLSSLFFLSPVITAKPITIVVDSVKVLDYGWLEPANSVCWLRSGSNISALGVWPKKQVLFRCGSILILIIIFLY